MGKIDDCNQLKWRGDFRSGRYLNFDSELFGTHLYRIIKVERLYELFESRRNVLVSPSLWEDPFENLILKARACGPNGEIGDFGFRDDIYGQCWTLQKASDALWRIYSPDKKAVRIRTTIGRLLQSLSANLADWAHEQSYIGKVRYLGPTKINAFAEGFTFDHLDAQACVSTLLIKRTAFEHEREVRLLYFERSNRRHKGGLFKYQIDPHDLIDQLMADPRLTPNEYQTFRNEILKRTSFKGRIIRSTLYEPPPQFTIRLT